MDRGSSGSLIAVFSRSVAVFFPKALMSALIWSGKVEAGIPEDDHEIPPYCHSRHNVGDAQAWRRIYSNRIQLR